MSNTTKINIRPILSLLSENNIKVKENALNQLLPYIDHCWPDVSSNILDIEQLCDPSCPFSQLASYVLSKCYYHLEEYDLSLQYAIKSGPYFNIDSRSEYIDSLLSYAIEKCIEYFKSMWDNNSGEPLDEHIQILLKNIYNNSLSNTNVELVISLCIDTFKLEWLEQCIMIGDIYTNLSYINNILNKLNYPIVHYYKILSILIRCSQKSNYPLLLPHANWLLELGDIDSLCRYYEYLFEQYGGEILLQLSLYLNIPTDTIVKIKKNVQLNPAILGKLNLIWTRKFQMKIELDCLCHQIHTDNLIYKDIKELTDKSQPHFQHFALICYSFLQYGTTNDSFLTANIEWVKKSSRWTRLAYIAGTGLIHHGHTAVSLKLLDNSLKKDDDKFLKAGAFYALGLLHLSDYSTKIKIFETIKNGFSDHDPLVTWGSCLSLGLLSIGSCNLEYIFMLKDALNLDDALSGESIGYSLGLISSGNFEDDNVKQLIDEMLDWASRTTHERTLRGLILGISMICYGKRELADPIITQLVTHSEQYFRYGGAFAIGLAYIGTNDNVQIQKLLNIAVSDVSDNVRRAAIISISFILINNIEHGISVYSLIIDNYNLHARYGAAIGLGIIGMGTGNETICNILKNLTKDNSDVVKQGAYLGLSFVYIQQNTPQSNEFRKTLVENLKSILKHPAQAFGMMVGHGILNAGGQNCTISLMKNGSLHQEKVLSLVLSLQYWYHFSLIFILGNCLEPTFNIVVNENLELVPDYQLLCNYKKSIYDYVPYVPEKKMEQRKKLEEAMLSTTNKTLNKKAKLPNSRLTPTQNSGDISSGNKEPQTTQTQSTISATTTPTILNGPSSSTHTNTPENETVNTDNINNDAKIGRDEIKQEDPSFIVTNKMRVTDGQLQYLSLINNDRYELYYPSNQIILGRYLVVKDLKPELNENKSTQPQSTPIDHLNVPQPFEYHDSDHEYDNMQIPSNETL